MDNFNDQFCDLLMSYIQKFNTETAPDGEEIYNQFLQELKELRINDQLAEKSEVYEPQKQLELLYQFELSELDEQDNLEALNDKPDWVVEKVNYFEDGLI
ncbi:hypothetical protein MWH28_07180 [Natroniella sulfidigena]|uniref:hypothetical protein n=1 Tax=Natroniella sulfidigena TaxID=723921 RepID=UPI00200B99D6|nr:hypothetical protein [Natroniella sulfidigena]MCK8817141.1 hypothetical protein [Natroniella sulfidigena]